MRLTATKRISQRYRAVWKGAWRGSVRQRCQNAPASKAAWKMFLIWANLGWKTWIIRKIEKRLSDMACNPDFVQLSSICVSAPGRLPWRIWWGDSCAYHRQERFGWNGRNRRIDHDTQYGLSVLLKWCPTRYGTIESHWCWACSSYLLAYSLQQQ